MALILRKMEENLRSRDKNLKYHLYLEDYDAYFNNPTATSGLSSLQLDKIFRLHGFNQIRYKTGKVKILEALSGIDNLVDPHSSTLEETVSPCNAFSSIDEVDADLGALKWLEEFPVQSLQCMSFNNDSANIVEINARIEKRGKKRVRKVKERKVFDVVHLTKPRSKRNSVKRKHLSGIVGIGGSACLA